MQNMIIFNKCIFREKKNKRTKKKKKDKNKPEGWLVFSWKGKRRNVVSAAFSTFQLCLIEDLVEGKVIVSSKPRRILTDNSSRR